MIKFEKNYQSIEIISFSRNILIISLLFLIALILAVLFKKPTPELKDIIISLIPIIVVFSIVKKIKLELNRPRNTGRLESSSLLGKKIINFGVDEIKEVKLDKGRGGSSSGNMGISIFLENGKRLIATQSDAFQSNKEIVVIYEELEKWIKN